MPVFAVLVSLAALVPACSSKAALVGSGTACELATDCQDGLYCYKGFCTGDAGAAQQLAPTPDAGAAGTGTGAGTSDAAATSDAPSSTPIPEASVSD